jgi:uncharacterized membrane protein
MVVALLALIGALVATYLALFKLGVIGQISCSIGNCETVNTSRWAVFLRLPVAAWGVMFYALVLAVAVAGTTERLAESPAISTALLALTGWGVGFSAWLTWLELFVIHAICIWCVTSATIVALAFAASVLDWRERRVPARA